MLSVTKGGMTIVDPDVVAPIAVSSRRGTLLPELPSATKLLDVQLLD